MSEHKILLNERKQLSVTGVKDVNVFTEESIILALENCSLIIKGENLHVNKLSLEVGEVDVDGKVNSMQYIKENADRGFIRRLLK